MKLILFLLCLAIMFVITVVRQLIIRKRVIEAGKRLCAFYDYNDRRYNRAL